MSKYVWFKTTPQTMAPPHPPVQAYQIIGIPAEKDAPAVGMVFDIRCDMWDYSPEPDPDGQMKLMAYYPESLLRMVYVEVPSLDYAQGRPDWTQGEITWKQTDSASGAMGVPSFQSTPTRDVPPVVEELLVATGANDSSDMLS